MKAVVKKAELLDPDYVPPVVDTALSLSDLPETGGEHPLFKDFVKVWFERKKLGLSNGKHIDQNWSTLKTYVFPHIGRMRLDQIKQRHIIYMFEPVWRLRHETAHCASEPDQK